jgi:hypothetical protein
MKPGMTSELDKTFRNPARSGVYRVAAAGEVEACGTRAGLAVSRVPLEGAHDKAALLRAVAAALEFPDWFGHNWDALEDCLTDLSWRAAEAHLLILDGHAALPADVAKVFVDVLQSSAAKWAADDAPFFAVFVDPSSALRLPELR